MIYLFIIYMQVQWVNTYFAVYDKSTGAIATGFPKAGNALWAGFGGGCETNNDGDPIVQYDKAANRWVLTQFSVSTTPYLQCVAVSVTSGTKNKLLLTSTSFNINICICSNSPFSHRLYRCRCHWFLPPICIRV